VLAPGAVVLIALAAMVAVLVATGSAPGPTAAGLPDAGIAVRWSVPAARLLLDLCAIATVGALLVAALLAPRGRSAADAVRAATAWAGAWTVTAVAATIVTAAEVTGLPLGRLPLDQLVVAVWALPPTRALLLVAVVVGSLVALLVGMTTGPAGSLEPPRRAGAGPVAVALVLAVLALTPPLYAGHAAHAGEHDLATASLVVHVVAATVWIGGLAGIALYVRHDRAALAPAVERFSTLALGCFCALTLTGVVAGVAALGGSRAAWASPYAAVLAGKVTAAVVLGLLGWAHRRWTIDLVRAGRPHAFSRLAAVEIAVMGATVGLAVALSRTPGATGGGFLGRANRSVGPGEAIGPVALQNVLSDWRPEPLLTTAVVVALVAYVRAARHLSDDAGHWPARRTGFALAAGTLAVVAAGIATSYDARPVLALQAGQFVLLTLGVGTLAAASRADELVRRRRPAPHSRRQGWWADVTADPTTGIVGCVALAIAALLSPLATITATSAPTRMVVVTATIAAGWVAAAAVRDAHDRHVGVNSGPRAGEKKDGAGENGTNVTCASSSGVTVPAGVLGGETHGPDRQYNHFGGTDRDPGPRSVARAPGQRDHRPAQPVAHEPDR